ncbi:unnamed protein product [Rhizophagus irregularis]|nr:unnamed protein product [Rhizophagus irregularis]CAB4422617.1 unnamed protein product [Rhizophagus irregularis]
MTNCVTCVTTNILGNRCHTCHSYCLKKKILTVFYNIIFFFKKLFFLFFYLKKKLFYGELAKGPSLYRNSHLKIETSPDSLDELFLTLKKRIGNSLGDLGQFFFDNIQFKLVMENLDYINKMKVLKRYKCQIIVDGFVNLSYRNCPDYAAKAAWLPVPYRLVTNLISINGRPAKTGNGFKRNFVHKCKKKSNLKVRFSRVVISYNSRRGQRRVLPTLLFH